MAAKKKPAPKRGASRQTAPAKQPIPGWVWLAVGLTVGAVIVFLMKLEPGGDDIKRAKPEQQKADKVAETSKPAQATPQQPVKPKYDFYTLLPESEVIVPPEAVPEKTPPVPAQPALLGQTPPPAPPVIKPAATTQYFLQAGSFRKQADADKVRAQIILLGQSVKVESGTVKEETWYRVMVGPFSNREQLTGAQEQLAGAGFANLLLQQRQTRQ